jgi:hypothetical protein
MDKPAKSQRIHVVWIAPIAVLVAVIAGSAAENCCQLFSHAAESWGERKAPQRVFKEAPGYFEYAQPGSWRIYWVDNDRILYAGHSEEQFEERLANPSRYYYTLRIWNVKTGSVQDVDVAEGGHCYFEGYLEYEVKRTATQQWVKSISMNGTARNADSAIAWLHKARQPDERNHIANCKTYRDRDLGPEGACITPLLDDDGYVDATGGRCKAETVERFNQIRLGPIQAASAAQTALIAQLGEMPITYFPKLEGAGLALPIKSREIHFAAAHTRYVEWSRQYVSVADAPKDTPWRGEWPINTPRPVYLISRGGNVERVDIPWTTSTKASVLAAVPTRRGMVVANGQEAAFEDPGAAGLYLVQKNDLHRIRRGFIVVTSVSPNGCEVAFAQEFRGAKHFGKLFVVDVCEEPTQK